MEFYLVKDLVRLVSLDDEDGRSPQLEVNLKFPSLLRPLAQSKSDRDFVGKLRDAVVISEYELPHADFQLSVCEKIELEAQVQFKFDSYYDETEFGAFYYVFVEHNDKFKMSMTLSLCYLPTKNTPVSPDALFTMKKKMERLLWNKGDGIDAYGFLSDKKSEVGQIIELWDHEDGFIYSKLTIMVTLSVNTVERLMEEPEVGFTATGALTRKMLEEEICTDLEIRYADGKVAKAHRAVLSGKSKVFRAMFQATEMKEARTGKLEMVDMSEQGVRAFLRWMYWEDEEEPVSESIVAVELLMAGDQYDLEELVYQMKEIILRRRGCDEEWFCVESAVKLFKWANLKKMKDLKKKALSVLRFVGKTCPDKLVESEEYQEMVEDDAKAAKKLTQ